MLSSLHVLEKEAHRVHPVPVRKATDSAAGISLLLADTTLAAQCDVSLNRESNFPTSVDASLT